MASKRAIRRRACEGKQRYESRGEAANACYKPSLHPYQCTFCTGWHVGHRPRRRIVR